MIPSRRRGAPEVKKTQGKKTRPKKTPGRRRRFVEGVEEDSTEEDHTFKPADLRYFRNGDDKN
jgi:hypothetical protein